MNSVQNMKRKNYVPPVPPILFNYPNGKNFLNPYKNNQTSPTIKVWINEWSLSSQELMLQSNKKWFRGDMMGLFLVLEQVKCFKRKRAIQRQNKVHTSRDAIFSFPPTAPFLLLLLSVWGIYIYYTKEPSPIVDLERKKSKKIVICKVGRLFSIYSNSFRTRTTMRML